MQLCTCLVPSAVRWESFRLPEIGVLSGVKHHVGAMNQTESSARARALNYWTITYPSLLGFFLFWVFCLFFPLYICVRVSRIVAPTILGLVMEPRRTMDSWHPCLYPQMLALQAQVYHFILLTLYYRVKAFNFDKVQVTDFFFYR